MNQMEREIAAAALEPVTTDADGVGHCRFVLPPEFCGFAGHFPRHPVVPAIAQILLAAHVAEVIAGEPVRIAAVFNAKFLIRLGPDQELETRCRPRPAAGGLELDAQVLCDQGIASRFRLACELQTEEPRS